MGLTKISAQQISNIDYKQSVRVISLANVTLSAGAPATVDGVSLTAGDRILVAGQSSAAQNGLYQVQTVGTGADGTWVRTSDANEDGEIQPGMVVMVTQGNEYADTPWKLVTNGEIEIGVTELTFEENYSLAFGNIVANTTAVIADAVSASLTLTAGNNISILGNNTSKVITIATTDSITATGNVTAGNLVTTGLASLASITKTGSNGVGNIGQSDNSFNTVFAKATSAQYADVAERYRADQLYRPGTVLRIGGAAEVTVSRIYADPAVAGVVSTKPALIMNTNEQHEHAVEVALLGRVPCRVIGLIRRGDLVAASDLPGVATALQPQDYVPGCVIGKALQDHTDEAQEGCIEVLVGRL